ncbi:MAG TPA: hypothetical protein VEP92_07275 [Gaiellaceae bacterium]|nr:hypothetical protein [Gaiellaceae bacterium]
MTSRLELSDPRRSTVPDFIDPMEAWRVWRVCMHDFRIVLQSLNADTVWEPGIPLSAICATRQRSRRRPWRVEAPGHASPELECTCGIYGVRSAALARWYLERRPLFYNAERVVGRVALWGEVVESESGWRAERAYPIELFVPEATTLRGGPRHRAYVDEIVLALSAYRVPVEVLAIGDVAVA